MGTVSVVVCSVVSVVVIVVVIVVVASPAFNSLKVIIRQPAVS